MTGKLAQLMEELEGVIHAGDELEPAEKSDRALGLVARYLLESLARGGDHGQVSILMTLATTGNLSFAYPPHLAKGNVLPIDRNSLAGRVLIKRAVAVDNDFPGALHKGFYERLPDAEGNVRAIQKIVAAPLLTAGGQALGVVEVSRTGNTSDEAGPDFTPRDGESLQETCGLVAPYIVKTWVGKSPSDRSDTRKP